jgi:hypothetical protein
VKIVLRKVLGVILIILGFLALITPLTPGSWLILVGLEILGFGLGLRLLLTRKLSSVSRKARSFLNIKRVFRIGSSPANPPDPPGMGQAKSGDPRLRGDPPRSGISH